MTHFSVNILTIHTRLNGAKEEVEIAVRYFWDEKEEEQTSGFNLILQINSLDSCNRRML